MGYNNEIEPVFRSRIALATKSERTMHRVTHNPSSALPRETLYVRCPKLASGVVLKPNSLFLTGDIDVTGDPANRLVQNVSKNLFGKVVQKFEGSTLSDITRYQLIETYRDLYMHTKDRSSRTFYGISTDSMRKIQAGNEVPGPDSDESFLYEIYGNKFCYKLTHPMVTDHGSIYPSALGSHIEWQLTLSDPKYLIQGPGDMNYSLNNIQLEYETIQDPNLSRRIASVYNGGKGYLYEHVLHFKTSIWKESDTMLQENINVPRRSIRGILILFTKDQVQAVYNSESFINPKITSVDVTIEGISNRIYSQGYERRHLYGEVRRYFAQGVSDNDLDMDEINFWRDKFALFIDCRSFPDVKYHGSGMQLQNTLNGIQLAIRKDDTSDANNANIYADIYILSDAMLTIEDSRLKSIVY